MTDITAHTLDRRARPKPEVALWRLYLLRAMYALILVGMGTDVWPALFDHRPWDLWHGVGVSMLAALTLTCALGLRHPLKMLPILMFELAWKTIWVVAIALPAWRAGELASLGETVKACLLGVVIVPIVMPWGYVWTHYVRGAGDRWTPQS
jgi:hypothetical protein